MEELEVLLGNGEEAQAAHFRGIAMEYQQMNARLHAMAAAGADVQLYITHEMPIEEQRPMARMQALQKWMSRPTPRLGQDPAAWPCPPCPPSPSAP